MIGCLLFTFGCFAALLGAIIFAKAKKGEQNTLGGVIFIVGLICIGFGGRPAFGHDIDHPEHDDWYKTLMQPDNPAIPCCGKADGYWCDEISIEDAKTFCSITDDRSDAPLGRPHIPIGTKIEIPNQKLKWDRGNPTGHAVVFVSRSLYVMCFVQGTGI